MLCSVALSSLEEHEAKLAVPQMVRTAIRSQVFNLSNLIIVSVPYLKSATKLLNFPKKKTVSTSFLAKITHLHSRFECFSLFCVISSPNCENRSMKDSIKREQSQTSLNSAERENSRTKCKVKIQTMLGDIVVLRRAKRQSRARLYDETPTHRERSALPLATSKNFLKLAKEGYYDSTLFHRVIIGAYTTPFS